MDRKRREDPARRQPLSPPEPGTGPARDGGEHRIGREPKSGMHPQRASAGEGHQHSAVGVGDDRDIGRETGGAEPRLQREAHGLRIRP